MIEHLLNYILIIYEHLLNCQGKKKEKASLLFPESSFVLFVRKLHGIQIAQPF